MIRAILLLVQAAGVLIVRSGDRATALSVVTLQQGPMVSAQALADALGGRLRSAGADRTTLAAAGVELQFTPRVPFAKLGSEAIPLALEPVVFDGRLYLPVTVVSDVLPRVGNNLLFDAVRAELTQFKPKAADVPPRTTASRSGGNGTRDEADGVRAPPRVKKRVIVVDAGHGGPDKGMSGPIGAYPKIYEKDVTLQVARQVRDLLRERGVEVVMTRSSDTLIALNDRGRIANEKGGDLFLSIHVNAANPRWREPGAARGFETYFLSEAKTEDERRVEEMENEVVKYEVAADVPANDPLAFIVHDMEQNEHLRESSELAATMQQRLAAMHPGPNRGVKQAGFRVLLTALMPAVLVEIGFGTNPDEARYISSPAGQRKLAAAIAEAALRYLGQYERRMGAGGA